MRLADLSPLVARVIAIASIIGVVALQHSRPADAAGVIVPLQVDTEWVDQFYVQGVQAYRNGQLVHAVQLLYAYQMLSARVRGGPGPYDAQIDADVQAAVNVLYQGLNARNALPFVQNDLQNCRSLPQCSGGGSGLGRDLTPPMPQTNLPPMPPRLR